MLPPLEDGVLLEGAHDCTFDELARAFGRFQRSDRRARLVDRLKAYLDEARRSGLVAAVIVDGSFVTAKDEPEDIDLIVVLNPEIAWDALRPFEYNAVSKRMVRKLYGLEAYAYPEGSPEYEKFMELFQNVRPQAEYTSRSRKGALRIQL